MTIRQAKEEEFIKIFEEGYKYWNKKRSFEQYVEDNRKEDAYGKRYVFEVKGEVVSSLILLSLRNIGNVKAYGIGSVVTPAKYSGKGYATKLLEFCIKQISQKDSILFLYSDVAPSFYERLGFKVLPEHLQKSKCGVTMACCSDVLFEQLSCGEIEMITQYF